MNYDKKRIGLRLRSLRIDKGLTQEALADMSKVPQSTIQSYEKGTIVMGMENATKIADALQCTLDRLTCRVE